MKSPSKKVIIEVDYNQNTRYRTKSGIELMIIVGATSNRDHCIYNGKVRAVPYSDGIKNWVPIYVGDDIWCHYFIANKDYKIEIDGETLSWMDYDRCWFVIRDGEIVMLGDYLLCEPIEDPDWKTPSGIYLKPEPEDVKMQSIVRHKSPHVEGVEVGDRIIHTKHADFDIEVNGVTYYKMRQRNVLAIIDEVPTVEEVNL